MGVFGEERDSMAYIQAIKDIYEGIRTSVRTSGEDIEDSFIEIGLHEGSVLCLFLFTTVMDQLIKEIEYEEHSVCLTDDIILIDKTMDGLTKVINIVLDNVPIFH